MRSTARWFCLLVIVTIVISLCTAPASAHEVADEERHTGLRHCFDFEDLYPTDYVEGLEILWGGYPEGQLVPGVQGQALLLPPALSLADEPLETKPERFLYSFWFQNSANFADVYTLYFDIQGVMGHLQNAELLVETNALGEVGRIQVADTQAYHMFTVSSDPAASLFMYCLDATCTTLNAASIEPYNQYYLGNFSLGYTANVAFDTLVYFKDFVDFDTSSTVAWLYNSGSGRSCADIASRYHVWGAPIDEPTPSPTPSYVFGVPLSSGSEMVIARTITYGDIALVIAVIVLAIILVFYIAVRIPKLWI